MASGAEFEDWLVEHGSTERDVLVAIFKKSTGLQTVDLEGLQEAALACGWVDTQIQRIDDLRYAIRFVPRRPDSSWSATNREMARRLLEQGRIRATGLALLPPDL